MDKTRTSTPCFFVPLIAAITEMEIVAIREVKVTVEMVTTVRVRDR